MKSKKLSEQIIKTFKSNGFVLSEPDVLLDSEYIIQRSGENFKRSMLTFENEYGKEMCLRPDLTVASCIKFLERKSKSKIYYSGQAYRRTDKKGSDLINDQLGIEIFGSKDQLQEDSFLTDIKIEDLLEQIIRSFSEISEKKLSMFSEKNKFNPKIERTLEITYGLRNFIGNAVKYSNSLINIFLESNDKFTEIKVCDDGPGFAEDILKVLGEPYIRSKNKIITSKSGLGLGTFIGKTLLERMKATVSFGKCPETKGAMVTIKWNTKDLLAI